MAQSTEELIIPSMRAGPPSDKAFVETLKLKSICFNCLLPLRTYLSGPGWPSGSTTAYSRQLHNGRFASESNLTPAVPTAAAYMFAMASLPGRAWACLVTILSNREATASSVGSLRDSRGRKPRPQGGRRHPVPTSLPSTEPTRTPLSYIEAPHMVWSSIAMSYVYYTAPQND